MEYTAFWLIEQNYVYCASFYIFLWIDVKFQGLNLLTITLYACKNWRIIEWFLLTERNTFKFNTTKQ